VKLKDEGGGARKASKALNDFEKAVKRFGKWRRSAAVLRNGSAAPALRQRCP
jgi:hypothetical protein